MRLKKAFAVILAIAMVFGAVSLASAAPSVGGFADATDNKQANQIAYLRAIGVAKGDENGNFNPDAALTRQEFVTFVARLAGQVEAAEFMGGIPSRYLDDEDIADWARGPVNLADTNGWVLGYDDGKFHPTDSLTYAQAVTVLIRVLGHESSVTGVWPNAHIVKGINLGLNAGVSLSANTPISRADMGRLLYNALETERLEKVGDKWEPLASILDEGKVFGQAFEGKLTDVSPFTFDEDPDGWPTTAVTAHDDIVIVGADSTNLKSLIGLNVRVTVKGGKVTVIEATRTSKAATLVYDKYESVNDRSTDWATQWYAVFTDGTKVRVNTSTKVVVNGDAVDTTLSGSTDSAFEASLKNNLKKNDEVIVASSGGVATKLTITRVSAANQVVSADGEEKTKASDPQDHLKIVAGVGEATIQAGSAEITLNGEPASITDIKEDDIVNLTIVDEIDLNPTAGATYNAMKIAATRSSVQGTVTSVRESSTTAWVTLKLADGTNKEYELVNKSEAAAATGVVKLLLNAGGKVAKLVPVTGAAAKYVLLTDWYSVKEGSTTKYTAVVDQRGEEVELDLGTNNPSGSLGRVVTIEGGAITGTIQRSQVSTSAEVVAVDVANKRVTLRTSAGLVTTVDGFASYKDKSGLAFGDYVAIDSLKAGNKVQVALISGGDDDGKVSVIVTSLLTGADVTKVEVTDDLEITITFTNVVARQGASPNGFAVTVTESDETDRGATIAGVAVANGNQIVITLNALDAHSDGGETDLVSGDIFTISYDSSGNHLTSGGAKVDTLTFASEYTVP